MLILLIEDMGRFSSTLELLLKKNNHSVDVCSTIIRAQGFLPKSRYDCLIVDLYMNTLGLEPNQIKESYDGLFSGWIWLRDEVFKKDLINRKQVIIFSAYLDEFRVKMPNENTEGIIMIKKNNNEYYDDPNKNSNKILNALKKIEQYAKVKQ
jgi:CheY-like chemotaxis protein